MSNSTKIFWYNMLLNSLMKYKFNFEDKKSTTVSTNLDLSMYWGSISGKRFILAKYDKKMAIMSIYALNAFFKLYFKFYIS